MEIRFTRSLTSCNNEVARIHLNPFVPTFDLETAELHLSFATRFTPQYGDSFLETLRLQLLQEWIAPIANEFTKEMKEELRDSKPFGKVVDWKLVYSILTKHVQKSAQLLQTIQVKGLDNSDFVKESDVTLDVLKTLNKTSLQSIKTEKLELRCSNTDPNYGKLWFHCRCKPTETGRTVLQSAKQIIGMDLFTHAHIYIAAIMRRVAIKFILDEFDECKESKDDKDGELTTSLEREDLCGCEDKSFLKSQLCRAPSTKDLLLLQKKEDKVLLESSISGSDFVTGLIETNRQIALESLSLVDRRQALFGSDLVFTWKTT